MRWDDLVRPALKGAITGIKVMDAHGKVLAELTDSVKGISIGDAELEVVHSGVATTVAFRSGVDEVEFPMGPEAVHSGGHLKVST